MQENALKNHEKSPFLSYFRAKNKKSL